MRYYWVITEDLRGKCETEFCFFKSQTELNGYDLQLGNSFINKWPGDARFEFERHEEYIITEVFNNNKSWHLYSTRITDWLRKKQPHGVEYFPAKIVSTNTEDVLNNYEVVNVTNVLDVIELKHSKYDRFSGGELMMVMPCFSRKKLEQLRPIIFKTKLNELPLYASEEFKQFWKGEGLIGLDFREIKQY